MNVVWYDADDHIISNVKVEPDGIVTIPANAAYLILINSDEVPGQVA
jgi:hypothetical protein